MGYSSYIKSPVEPTIYNGLADVLRKRTGKNIPINLFKTCFVFKYIYRKSGPIPFIIKCSENRLLARVVRFFNVPPVCKTRRTLKIKTGRTFYTTRRTFRKQIGAPFLYSLT